MLGNQKHSTKYVIEGGELELRIKQSSTVEKMGGMEYKCKKEHIIDNGGDKQQSTNIITGIRTKHNVENNRL